MNDRLFMIAVAVAVVVIVCIALVFGVMFTLYALARVRGINGGVEDAEIAKDLKRKYSVGGSGVLSGSGLQDAKASSLFSAEERAAILHAFEKKRKKSCIGGVVGNIVFILFMIVIAAVTVCAVTYRAQGEQFFINGTAYLVVKTDSMGSKNAANPYYQSLPDNQIEAYSLIAVKSIGEDDEILLYDVIAYVYDGTTYVHRVVEINADEDGAVTYHAMGDANTGSFTFETALTRASILGVYTGFHSYECGVLFLYLQSNIGIISLVFAFLFLLAADISLGRVDACLEKRTDELLGLSQDKKQSGK